MPRGAVHITVWTCEALLLLYHQAYSLFYYRGHPIPAHVQVLCSLGLLATGNFQTTNADRSGISQPSLSRVLTHVLDGIIRLAPTHIKFPYTPQEQFAIKQDFYAIAGFPNTIGAIDCTHIRIRAPSPEPYPYFNRKGYHSINVQLICDANMNILNAVTRWPGGSHDAFILQNSSVGMRLEREAAGDAWLIGELFNSLYLKLNFVWFNCVITQYHFSHIRLLVH